MQQLKETNTAFATISNGTAVDVGIEIIVFNKLACKFLTTGCNNVNEILIRVSKQARCDIFGPSDQGSLYSSSSLHAACRDAKPTTFGSVESRRHSMEIGPLEELSLQCYCGKVFSQQSALTNHTRSCKQSNKRLASALTVAKEAWEARKSRKRQKTGEHEPEQVISEPTVVLEELEPSHSEVCL